MEKQLKKTKIAHLRDDLTDVMTKHGLPQHHIQDSLDVLEGAGLFDFLKKAVTIGKKAVGFYNDNKDTIHKVAKKAIGAYDGYKSGGIQGLVQGAIGGAMAGGARSGGSVARAGGARSGGAKPAAKRTSPWIEKCKKYARENGVTYGEAMKALSSK